MEKYLKGVRKGVEGEILTFGVGTRVDLKKL